MHSERNHTQKSTVVQFNLYKISGTDKSIETKSAIVDRRGGERRGVLVDVGFLSGAKKGVWVR